ncbi:hypothetical protein [Streptomyces filamentosus]|uniref:hypothetical protein n=1 Tax=Streptomyces filamentosus TaxID=67294 RepID=UPI00123B0830|nr:hypothetical protein [Streptomyces filamentosus]KAA6215652.1 hypothetical protein CP979_00640 [Streptomyces filamentosus]
MAVIDPRFDETTFIVIDFEGLTPAGRPAEPVEVAALALRPEHGRLVETGRFEELIRPPADVPVTAMDVRLKGITERMLAPGAPASVVMARLDAGLPASPCRPVAHHASTDPGIIARQHEPRCAGSNGARTSDRTTRGRKGTARTGNRRRPCCSCPAVSAVWCAHPPGASIPRRPGRVTSVPSADFEEALTR